MAPILRNVFISHIHEDDEGLSRLKDLVARHGMDCRDGSITTGKFNGASNEEYIKYGILKPRIEWASVLVVYVSHETKNSDWANWEIEYAHEQGKRIVGVCERGAKDPELPEALQRYGDAVVGWDGAGIIDAIAGLDTARYSPAADVANPASEGLTAADLHRRLDNFNRHFRRKAAAVLNDEAALRLLAAMYSNVVVETDEFDFCQHGRALAKLAAANFCEIGANSIYITESGQRFIDNINKNRS